MVQVTFSGILDSGCAVFITSSGIGYSTYTRNITLSQEQITQLVSEALVLDSQTLTADSAAPISAGAIVGIVIGSALCVVAAIIFTLLLLKKKKQQVEKYEEYTKEVIMQQSRK